MGKATFFAGALFLTLSLSMAACSSGSPEPTATATRAPAPTATRAAPTATPVPPTPTSAPVASDDTVWKVGMAENPYRFVPDKYTLKNGVSYTLEIAAPKEFHSFTIDDLGVNIFVNPGQAVKQVVPVNKAGTFKLKCLPHEALGMVGEVVVS